MAGGECKYSGILNRCQCDSEGVVIWHYIKGTANRVHYFVKCKRCMRKSRDRKKVENTVKDWNNGLYEK